MDYEFAKDKRRAIKAANDLLYGEKVVKKIKAAKTLGEINRIMMKAREEKVYE